MKAEDIRNLFKRYQFRFGDELDLQNRIEEMLKAEGINFLRETPLDEKSRPDFLITNPHALAIPGQLPFGLLALEVKVDGDEYHTLEQLERYAKDHRIESLVVVSSKKFKWNDAFLLENKPVHYIKVIRKFLQ